MRSQIPKTNGRILLSGKVIVIEICVRVTVCVIGAIGRGLVFGVHVRGWGLSPAIRPAALPDTWRNGNFFGDPDVGGWHAVPCTPRLGCHDMLP